MNTKWKKAFIAATISILVGAILIVVSGFALGWDMDQLSITIGPASSEESAG